MDSVPALQHALYRAAKADPGRRSHSLWDKILRRNVLERAWEDVRRNGGAAGIDRVTITDVEEYGVSRLLDEVTAALREGLWRPLPSRRVFIPKRSALRVVAGHDDRMLVMNRRLVVLRVVVASLNRRRCRRPARS